MEKERGKDLETMLGKEATDEDLGKKKKKTDIISHFKITVKAHSPKISPALAY